jgi:hypothetical protein
MTGGLTFQIRSNTNIQVGRVALLIQEAYPLKSFLDLLYCTWFLPLPFQHFAQKPLLFLIFKHNRKFYPIKLIKCFLEKGKTFSRRRPAVAGGAQWACVGTISTRRSSRRLSALASRPRTRGLIRCTTSSYHKGTTGAASMTR